MRAKTERLEQRVHARVRGAPGQALATRDEPQVLARGEPRLERRFLKHDADALAHARGLRERVEAVDEDAPAARRRERRDERQQRSLARAVQADHRDQFAVPDRDPHALQDRAAAALQAHVLQVDAGSVRFSRFARFMCCVRHCGGAPSC
ncbi:hypothetical protein DO70_6349 [Burkholderia pseudomallei]|nr:hypothetical protein DO70_6349 [Burkholderia pseudomallei]